MDELNKVERPHSSSVGEVECFSSRLIEIIGSESVRSFAMKADLSQTAIQKYSTGDSTPNVERLIAIAKAGGVTVQWLATGKGPKYESELDDILDSILTPCKQLADEAQNIFEAEFALIPGYDVQVSAGFGSEGSDATEPTRHLAFRKRWLKWRGFSKNELTLVWAKGDSMEPTISDNDTLLVHMGRNQPTDGNIYVIRSDNQLWVKRLQVLPGAWRLISDNKMYDPIEVPKSEQDNFEVVGQVVHISKDIGN